MYTLRNADNNGLAYSNAMSMEQAHACSLNVTCQLHMRALLWQNYTFHVPLCMMNSQLKLGKLLSKSYS